MWSFSAIQLKKMVERNKKIALYNVNDDVTDHFISKNPKMLSEIKEKFTLTSVVVGIFLNTK